MLNRADWNQMNAANIFRIAKEKVVALNWFKINQSSSNQEIFLYFHRTQRRDLISINQVELYINQSITWIWLNSFNQIKLLHDGIDIKNDNRAITIWIISIESSTNMTKESPRIPKNRKAPMTYIHVGHIEYWLNRLMDQLTLSSS